MNECEAFTLILEKMIEEASNKEYIEILEKMLLEVKGKKYVEESKHPKFLSKTLLGVNNLFPYSKEVYINIAEFL